MSCELMMQYQKPRRLKNSQNKQGKTSSRKPNVYDDKLKASSVKALPDKPDCNYNKCADLLDDKQCDKIAEDITNGI